VVEADSRSARAQVDRSNVSATKSHGTRRPPRRHCAHWQPGVPKSAFLLTFLALDWRLILHQKMQYVNCAGGRERQGQRSNDAEGPGRQRSEHALASRTTTVHGAQVGDDGDGALEVEVMGE